MWVKCNTICPTDSKPERSVGCVPDCIQFFNTRNNALKPASIVSVGVVELESIRISLVGFSLEHYWAIASLERPAIASIAVGVLLAALLLDFEEVLFDLSAALPLAFFLQIDDL